MVVGARPCLRRGEGHTSAGIDVANRWCEITSSRVMHTHHAPHSLAVAGRISPSCMTEATSTPRAASHSRPDASPVPPLAAGDSISINSHSSALNGAWNHMLWSMDA
jgi:hypothetical protein